MKTIKSEVSLSIPTNGKIEKYYLVSAKIKGRTITISSGQNSLTRSFKSVLVSFKYVKSNNKIYIGIWNGTRRELAVLDTFKTHILNMIKGVTQVIYY